MQTYPYCHGNKRSNISLANLCDKKTFFLNSFMSFRNGHAQLSSLVFLLWSRWEKKKCKCIVLRYTKRKYPFHTLTNISLLYSHSVSSLQTLELFENTYSLVLLFCEGQSSMLIICSFLFEILFLLSGPYEK